MNGLKVALLLLVIMITGCAGDNVRSPQERADASAAYTRLGLEYLQTQDLQGAKNAFQKALSLNEKEAQALNGLALVFQMEQEMDLSETYFRKAIAADVESAQIYNNYGAFLFSQKRYSDACRQLARATEDPFYGQRGQAFENLGRCYLHLERKDAAEHALQRALQLNPNRPLALVQLSELLLDKGEAEQAGRHFERFSTLVEKKRVNHFPKSLWLGIQLSRYQGDSVQAATYALILKNLYPESTEYRQYEESTH